MILKGIQDIEFENNYSVPKNITIQDSEKNMKSNRFSTYDNFEKSLKIV